MTAPRGWRARATATTALIALVGLLSIAALGGDRVFALAVGARVVAEHALFDERWSRLRVGRRRVDDTWARTAPPIAHALGALDGRIYRNDAEALQASYARGVRAFEVDLAFTRDDSLVATHDWERWNRVLRLTRPRYAAFMRPRPGSTPLDARALLRWLDAHPDAWLVLDTKDDMRGSLRALVRAAGRDAPALRRIVPQLYGPPDLETAEGVYPWSSYVYTLYRTRSTDAQVRRFAAANRIPVVALGMWQVPSRALDQLRPPNGTLYVYTVNDSGAYCALRGAGVDGVYTDSLLGPRQASLARACPTR